MDASATARLTDLLSAWKDQPVAIRLVTQNDELIAVFACVPARARAAPLSA
jgi:hypothetical protein